MNKFDTLIESTLMSEKIQPDGTATHLTDLWKFDGPEHVPVFDTFWTRLVGDLSTFDKTVTFRKAARILGKYNPGDRIKPADKLIIIEDLALDSTIQKRLKDYNPKLAANLAKNKQVKEFIDDNRNAAIKRQTEEARSEQEKKALWKFFNKYGDKMSVYDVYHTYADLTPLEDSGDEYISTSSRASVFSSKYVGEVTGGKFEMEFTDKNPIIVTDVRGL